MLNSGYSTAIAALYVAECEQTTILYGPLLTTLYDIHLFSIFIYIFLKNGS